MKQIFLLLSITVFFMLVSCSAGREVSPEDVENSSPEGLDTLLSKTTSKPWKGEDFSPGKVAGTWNSAMIKDPKSFNLLVAERDAETNAIVDSMHDSLLEYDVIRREWKARVASPEIVVDEKEGTLKVIFTLRDDLYWSYYNASSPRIKVSSDDMIFWYNEIEGDPEFESSAYNSQFITMENGEEAHIDIEKIDDRRFSFNFPRIVADPMLSTNTNFGPRFIFEKAKKEKGVQGVLDLFSVDTDPKAIPSMGPWFLTEYQAGQRLVFKRNGDFWEKDSNGVSIPYQNEKIVRILPDQNTQFLVFKEAGIEAYGSRPEDLDELVNGQSPEDSGYTVFNAEGSLGATLWSFNQNPQNKYKKQSEKFSLFDWLFKRQGKEELNPEYEWFTKKEFRQAMSSILNRDRIINQVYRGLAQAKLDFFPAPNPYYNQSITLQYTYNPEKALTLLASIGMKRDKSGTLRDDKNRAVEFDLSISSDATVLSDIASIIMDEAEKIGVKINIRLVDFQKLVEQLSGTYDWSSVIIGLGSNMFPTQGSNVWPSDGNLHLWYPLQESPATDWEARVDYLYNEGKFTIDPVKARKIWDEYQTIILEQCPVIYLLRSRNFTALRNRWDFTNVYYDNLNGLEASRAYLKQ